MFFFPDGKIESSHSTCPEDQVCFLGGNFFFKKYRVFPALTKSDYGKMNQCSDGITVQKIIVRMCRKKSRNDKNKEVLINT